MQAFYALACSAFAFFLCFDCRCGGESLLDSML